MTTPHQEVENAFLLKSWTTNAGYIAFEGSLCEITTTALDALRTDAVARVRGLQFTHRQMGTEPVAEDYVNAILGFKNTSNT